MAKPVDWEALRTEYATTDVSLRDIAKKYDLAVSTITGWSVRTGWAQARAEFRAKVAAKTTEKKAEFRARTEAEIDARMHLITDELSEVIRQRVRQALEDLKKPAVEDDDKDPKKPKGAKRPVPTALDFKLLGEAARTVYELQRVTTGLPRQKIPDQVDLNVEGSVGVAVQTGVVELPAEKDE